MEFTWIMSSFTEDLVSNRATIYKLHVIPFLYFVIFSDLYWFYTLSTVHLFIKGNLQTCFLLLVPTILFLYLSRIILLPQLI